jgi:transposase InsO family protein
MALAFSMWGHPRSRGCGHDGVQVSDATCLRVLRDSGLVLPVDYVRERRDLAKARREAFVTIPTRRNRVWQTDFFELETSGGGTWRSGDVIDYATKLVLAGPVTATQTTRDAINAIEDARCQVHDLLGHCLLDDVTCTHTGRLTPVIVVSDNGPATTVTASRATSTAAPPQTNGVIERYHGAIQIEELWRDLPADGAEMTLRVEAFRQLYNTITPHETLAGTRPIERYLANPDQPLSAPLSTPVPTRQNVRIP